MPPRDDLGGEQGAGTAGGDVDRDFSRSGGGAPDRLTIASWDLRDAEVAGIVRQPKAVKRVWRHTFGSERRATARQSEGAGDIDADVVLLQGVRSAKMARKLFPARDWRLILSRQLLDLTGFNNRFAQPLPDGKSITAIAVRYSRHIRITGHEHFMPMTSSPRENVLPQPVAADEAGNERGAADLGSGDVSPVLRTIAQRDETAASSAAGVAGLAVRILHVRDVIWVVSADFGEECRPEDTKCAQRAFLDTWTKEQRASGFMVVRGEKSGAKEVAEPSEPAASKVSQDAKSKPAKPAKSTGFFFWQKAASEPEKQEAKPQPTAAADQKAADEIATSKADCTGQSLLSDPKLAGDLKVVTAKGCLAILSVAR